MSNLRISFTNAAPVSMGMRIVGIQGPPGSGGGGGVTDGDKGGIVVSGTGTIWTVKAGSITDLMLGASAIALFAAASHTHTIANITGLQSALDGKAGTTHTHAAADVTDFAAATRGTDLTGYAAAGSRLALASSDTILGAFNKIGKWLGDLGSAAFAAASAAGLAMLTAADVAAQTNLLNTFTTALKGLVPAPGSATGKFLRDDGTWVTVAAGGDVSAAAAFATDNRLIRSDGTGKGVQASGIDLDDSDVFTFPLAATPAAPAAGVKVFGRDMGGYVIPGFRSISGRAMALQPSFSETRLSWWQGTGNGGTDTQSGFVAGSSGTSTTVSVATTNFRTMIRMREWLVTTPSTTAIASFRGGALSYTVGNPAANAGGFFYSIVWCPATGLSNASHRAFVGMRSTIAAPSDVDPSTLLNVVGIGYDAADTNFQFMHNDGSGTCTKIDLGSGLPKPSVDRTKAYHIMLYSPPGTTQSVSYLIRDLETGDEATGTVTTNLPSTTTLLGPNNSISVGGVSAVTGVGVGHMIIETDF